MAFYIMSLKQVFQIVTLIAYLQLVYKWQQYSSYKKVFALIISC